MKLTTRMVIFGQAMLAIVLLLFCLILYASAYWYIAFQADASVQRALDTLVASVDIEEDTVEWEPTDRELSLGVGPMGGTLFWYITDANRHPVDRAPAHGTSELMVIAGAGVDPPETLTGWIVARKLVHPPGASGAQLTRKRTSEEIEKGEYPALVFTTGMRTGPLYAAVNTLAVGLGTVSVAIWLLSFVAAGWLSRRALRPLTKMAGAARAMNADDASAELPAPESSGELDDLHAAFSGLLDRLRAAIERERQLTAEASHQLRTPIGAIIGQVDVALRQPRSTEEYERVLEVVRRQARDLARSVEAILFLARAEADAPAPALECIDLVAWTTEFVNTYHHPRGADLAVIFDGLESARVRAHPQLLTEMVGNLIDNALKYSERGSPVSIRVCKAANRIQWILEDRGRGIDANDLPHLFEPFYRAAISGHAPTNGAGLGLAVVARIAKAFQGNVIAEQRPGGGARFVLSLPEFQDKENFISPSRGD